MALYTKCIFHPALKEDGIRISVMSRHTLNDGKTPDTRIIPGITFDEWIKILAPPDKLMGDYYKRRKPFEEFEFEYTKHLRSPEAAEKAKELARRALTRDLTLLCVEEIPNMCHRRVLAEKFQLYEPKLNIVVR